MKVKFFEDFTKNDLWALRNEISLGSLFVYDYENSFNLDPHTVSDFFDGYVDYLDNECGGIDNDSIDNLFDWFCCYDDLSFMRYDLEELVDELNGVTEEQHWIEDGRYFVCYDTDNMDNIDEISEKELINKINRKLVDY